MVFLEKGISFMYELLGDMVIPRERMHDDLSPPPTTSMHSMRVDFPGSSKGGFIPKPYTIPTGFKYL